MEAPADFGTFIAPKPKKADKPLDDTAKLLQEALSRYQSGQFKASVERAAAAINKMAYEKNINGGAWS